MGYLSAFFRSMAGRIFLVLLVGSWLAFALSFWIVSGGEASSFAQIRGHFAADRVAHWLALADALPTGERGRLAVLAEREGVRLSFAPAAPGDDAFHPLRPRMEERLAPGIRLLALRQGREVCAPDETTCDGPRRLWVSATLSDGSPATVDVPDTPLRHRPAFLGRMAAQMTLFALALALLAAGVAYWVTRPLRGMARAALALGRNIDQPPLPETGPAEVKDASRAFNRMQTLIRRHVEERTGLLAAITHDLQTPLTRMRLRLENASADPLRNKLLGDLEQMKLMVREGLDLARSLDAAAPGQLLDLDSLVNSTCADQAEGGDQVRCNGESGTTVLARPLDLRRCLSNLIGNAVKYGGSAEVAIAREGQEAVVRVRDRGPGIPDDQLERVLDPFVRLETSRSRETGGTGLGLAIARNIARAHGGSLTLRNRAEGGLEAELRLPVAQRTL